MENETVSKNFIEQIIDKDLAEGRCKDQYIPGSRRSPMDICISDMQNPFC